MARVSQENWESSSYDILQYWLSTAGFMSSRNSTYRTMARMAVRMGLYALIRSFFMNLKARRLRRAAIMKASRSSVSITME